MPGIGWRKQPAPQLRWSTEVASAEDSAGTLCTEAGLFEPGHGIPEEDGALPSTASTSSMGDRSTAGALAVEEAAPEAPSPSVHEAAVLPVREVASQLAATLHVLRATMLPDQEAALSLDLRAVVALFSAGTNKTMEHLAAAGTETLHVYDTTILVHQRQP